MQLSARRAPPRPCPTASAPPQKQQKKKKRLGLWIFLGCLAAIAVAVGIGLAVSGGSDAPGGDLPEDGSASSIIDIFQDKQTSIPASPATRPSA